MKKIFFVLFYMFLSLNMLFSKDVNDCGGKLYQDANFLLGEWEVIENGIVIGESIIEKKLDGCIIIENKQSNRSLETSMNNIFYSKTDSLWFQFFFNDIGENYIFYGQKQADENGLKLFCEMPSNKPEINNLHTIEWLPQENGSVHFEWLYSEDLGENWETKKFLIYVKKKNTENSK